MRLERYADFASKSHFFEEGAFCIATKKDFDLLWDRLLDWQKIVGQPFKFRGCTEACWKLNTSAQRFWAERDLDKIDLKFDSFLRKLIDSASGDWNDGVVRRFFEENNLHSNDLAVLSYMQHFNLPTPLLDFTINPFVALFFALERLAVAGSDSEIDQYCSVYAIDERNPFFKKQSELFEKTLAVSSTDFLSIYSKFEMLLVDHNLVKKFGMTNNLNIVNQSGVFLMTNVVKYSSEQLYREIVEGQKVLPATPAVDPSSYPDRIGFCFNIHKSLRNYALQRLRQDPVKITPEFIYPDNRKLAEWCLNAVLENLEKPD